MTRLAQFSFRLLAVAACVGVGACGGQTDSQPPRSDSEEPSEGDECSGPAPNWAAGEFSDSEGSEHWFSETPAGLVYSLLSPRLASGDVDVSSPPLLRTVLGDCGTALSLEQPSGGLLRIPYARNSGRLFLCLGDPADDAAEPESQFSLPGEVATSDPRTCLGRPWVELVEKESP